MLPLCHPGLGVPICQTEGLTQRVHQVQRPQRDGQEELLDSPRLCISLSLAPAPLKVLYSGSSQIIEMLTGPAAPSSGSAHSPPKGGAGGQENPARQAVHKIVETKAQDQDEKGGASETQGLPVWSSQAS